LRRFSATDREPRRSTLLERYGGVLLLAVMFVIFAMTLHGQFLTYKNLVGVIGNQAIAGLMALALLLPLAAGIFDISIGGAMTLAVILVTWLFQTTAGSMPIPVRIRGLGKSAGMKKSGAGRALSDPDVTPWTAPPERRRGLARRAAALCIRASASSVASIVTTIGARPREARPIASRRPSHPRNEHVGSCVSGTVVVTPVHRFDQRV